MAIISGVTVVWDLSPRIIQIPIPITEITVEDLQDTLLNIEDSEEGVVFPKLRDTSGGEDLTGGVFVGYTMKLNNAQVMFEPRTSALETGGCTTGATTAGGKIHLIASGGQFVTNGIYVGCTVFNATTGAMAVVVKIVSETELVSLPLTGGSRTDWQVSDGYAVYPNVQCAVTGGNLVAVDSGGSSISSIMQSPNVQVIKSSSSSSTSLQNDQFEQTYYATLYKDKIYISAGGCTGTEYPCGTFDVPVGSIASAITIAETYNLGILHFHTDFTIPSGADISDYIVESHNSFASLITIDSGAIVEDVRFRDIRITGTLDGSVCSYENCSFENISNVNGAIYGGIMDGTVTAYDNASARLGMNGVRSKSQTPVTLVIGAATINATEMFGMWTLTGKDTSAECNMHFGYGVTSVAASCTAGTIYLAGTGSNTDNSDPGCTVIDQMVNPAAVDANIVSVIGDPVMAGSNKETNWGGTP